MWTEERERRNRDERAGQDEASYFHGLDFDTCQLSVFVYGVLKAWENNSERIPECQRVKRRITIILKG
jgi:hypothetical protein